MTRLERFMLVWNAVATAAWVILFIPSVLWWQHSILWVVIMSAYANLAASLAGLTASLLTRRAEANRSAREP